MSRYLSLGVMTTLFAFLPLDLDAPTLNLCIMAVLRYAVLAAVPDTWIEREQMA